MAWPSGEWHSRERENLFPGTKKGQSKERKNNIELQKKIIRKWLNSFETTYCNVNCLLFLTSHIPSGISVLCNKGQNNAWARFFDYLFSSNLLVSGESLGFSFHMNQWKLVFRCRRRRIIDDVLLLACLLSLQREYPEVIKEHSN